MVMVMIPRKPNIMWCLLLFWITDTTSFCTSRRYGRHQGMDIVERQFTAISATTLSESISAEVQTTTLLDSTTTFSYSALEEDYREDRLSIFKSDGEYNGLMIDSYYNSKPLLVWERFLDIGSPLLGWWLIKKFNNVTSSFRTSEENQMRRNLSAIDLKDSIVQTKSVTLIKSGQALALRPDLIKSVDYIRELTRLQDEVGVFSNEAAMQIMKEDLGRDPHEIYTFDPLLPIASASIGQVYRAILKETNETVAVKVQRPDAIEYAALDMFILRKGAAFLKSRFKLRSDLVGIVDVFGAQLFKELDYVQEAHNCLKFKDMYGGIPNIYVPSAYLNLTNRRVLTMEFVEGVKGPWNEGGERMLTLGLQCSVLQLLGTGYFHSDPHRGNLLQSPSGDLVYLDFGMMSEVPADQRFALIGAVIGLVNKDITLVISNLKKLDFFPPNTDEQVIVTALTSAVMNATDNGEGSSLNFTKLSKNIAGISDVLPFRLPPFYSFIIRTLTILEGLALYVDPSFRLIKGAYPFVAKQMLTAPSAEMTSLLKSILINQNNGKIKWEKLEQFVSIASNADAAVNGNFEALKQAQDRSDVSKIYTNGLNDENEINITYDITLSIMDFLLSENGKFLFDPLITEIVDIIDALGLTALTLSSVLTNGLLPAPNEKPNRAKVELFFKLVSTILNRVDNNEVPGGNQRLTVVRNMFKLGSDIIQNSPDVAKLQPVISKSSIVVEAVVSKLVERSTRSVIKNIMNPKNIVPVFPLVSRFLDFVVLPLLPKSTK